jgi:hypothetical protein
MESHEQAGGVSADAALEVLAYLITAARTQLDEAAEYAPMRLLTAAQRLADAMRPSDSAPVQQLIAAVGALTPTATPSSDRDAYVAMVDGLCSALADCLLAVEPAVVTPERP